MKRLISALLIVLFFLILGYILLIYATGKRLTRNGDLVGVGIIQIDTTPDNSKIYINGEHKDDGDTNLENLRPGKYSIKVEKDNYSPWQKEIEVIEGKITPLKVKLFPSNPSLTAATFNGVYSPRISPDGSRIAFGSTFEGKKGLWILELQDRQLFFNNNTQRQIVVDTNNFTFSNASFSWSPDSKAILVDIKNNSTAVQTAFLLKPDVLNTSPEDVTQKLATLKESWAEQLAKSNTDKLKSLGKEAEVLASHSKEILFSADNSAFIVVKEDQTATVYDTKPSPVPGVKPLQIDLPSAERYLWFQDGTKHIIVLEKNLISLMDTDATNKASIFTGDFDKEAVFSWPNGSRLILTLNLNSRSNPLPNLYTIDLR